MLSKATLCVTDGYTGTAYDWDILVVAVLNAFLSIVGLPWMHGVLPHSPLHARALSDSEERVVEGYVQHVRNSLDLHVQYKE